MPNLVFQLQVDPPLRLDSRHRCFLLILLLFPPNSTQYTQLKLSIVRSRRNKLQQQQTHTEILKTTRHNYFVFEILPAKLPSPQVEYLPLKYHNLRSQSSNKYR